MPKENNEQTILQQAQGIVYDRVSPNGERRPYGPFSECMKAAARIFNEINPYGEARGQVTTEEMYFALVALKLAREKFEHKTDNLVDICGYLAGLDDFIAELKAENEVKPTPAYTHD